MSRALIVLLGIFLAGCAADGRNLQPGADATAVRAQMGSPGEVVRLPDGGEAWFYPGGRVRRQTFRAELGPDGRLRKVEQVLDERHFARIVPGKTTREELRRLLGSPEQEFRGYNETVWQYHYLWTPNWPYRLHVGIGDDGIVTGLARLSELDGPRSN
ncbi:MAG TPA: hypothetical protein VF211_07585 [Burkholderiales bacterium]